MPRTDIHLDAMLRHLGAAYYESLHGRATRADVTRAIDAVEDHLQEHARGPQPASGRHPAGHRGAGPGHPGGWAHTVRDVMTTSVVTVDRITPYKEIAHLLAAHRISGLPVLKMGRQVVGVVTEADLLSEEVKTSRRLHDQPRGPWHPRRRPGHPALTAGELMSAPAITVGPDATLPTAARLMDNHHIRRLPVVNENGKLLGIVSRRDLLSVFLRPDEDIAADVRRVLDDFLGADPDKTQVTVRNGVVILTGTLALSDGHHEDLIPVAIRLMWDVDGVVDVQDRLGEARREPAAEPGGSEDDEAKRAGHHDHRGSDGARESVVQGDGREAS